jgi:hypothetical protein
MSTAPHPIPDRPDEKPRPGPAGPRTPYPVNDPGFADPNKPGSEPVRLLHDKARVCSRLAFRRLSGIGLKARQGIMTRLDIVTGAIGAEPARV